MAQTFALVQPILHRFSLRNCPKCTQNVGIAPKHKFRVQWGGSDAFVAKNSDATSWHELLHQFGTFLTEFRNSTKRSQCPKIIRNAPKHQFRVQYDISGAFVSKNFDATSCHELLYQFAPSCTEFRKSTKRSPMHQNCTKCTRT